MAAIALGLTAILSSPAAQAQGQPVALGGVVTATPAAGYDTDQRLYLFGRGTDRALYFNSRPAAGGPWAGWQSLGGILAGSPAVGMFEGRLAVFVRGTDNGAHYRVRQNVPGQPFTNWTPLGGVLTSDPVVGMNTDGRPELFARGTDNALWHNTQFSRNGVWSGWQSLGRPADVIQPAGWPLEGAPAVGMNKDGRLTVFVRDTLGAIRARTQVGPGQSFNWTNWTVLGGIANSDPVVIRGWDGTLTVFFRSGNELAFITQVTPNAIEKTLADQRSWRIKGSLGYPGGGLTGNPTVVIDYLSRLNVFVRDAGNRIHRSVSYFVWQPSTLPNGPGSDPPAAPEWVPWSPLQFTASQDPVAFREATNNNAVLFGADAGGAVWEMPASLLGIR